VTDTLPFRLAVLSTTICCRTVPDLVRHFLCLRLLSSCIWMVSRPSDTVATTCRCQTIPGIRDFRFLHRLSSCIRMVNRRSDTVATTCRCQTIPGIRDFRFLHRLSSCIRMVNRRSGRLDCSSNILILFGACGFGIKCWMNVCLMLPFKQYFVQRMQLRFTHMRIQSTFSYDLCI